MIQPRWGLLCFVALSGCGPLKSCTDAGKKPIVYVDISGEKSKLDEPTLEASLRQVMDELPGYAFRNAKKDETKWQLDARLKFVNERPADSKQGLRRSVGVQLRLFALKKGLEPNQYSTDFVHAEDVADSVSASDFAAEALVKAGAELKATLLMYEASPTELVAALSSTEERVRARAVLVAQNRKLMEALPRLMEIVRNEDESPEVVLKAIGALVRLGDSQATPALIDAARRKNSAYVAQVVYAVGQLGGKEAQAYLFTVSSGHPDPMLREAAKEALQELEKKLDEP